MVKTPSADDREFLTSIKTGKSQHKLFNEIATSMSKLYDDKISKSKANEAARNLIDFCQVILNYQLKQQRKQNQSKESRDE